MIDNAQPVFNLCGWDSPQLATTVVIPAHAGIQYFVRGHRPSPVQRTAIQSLNY